MKERPIIFTENIDKILDGTKTMTRRVMKPQPRSFLRGDHSSAFVFGSTTSQDEWLAFSPYGQVGDRLWVRETWAVDALWDDVKPSEISPLASVWYPSGADLMNIPMWVGKMRVSMFMPRWASRITLDITEVRVERLLEITGEDISAEGTIVKGWTEDGSLRTPHACFEWLWDSLNAKRGYGWLVNPWVWVISFKKV